MTLSGLSSSCLLLAARKNSSAADPTHLFNCYGQLCPFHALSLYHATAQYPCNRTLGADGKDYRRLDEYGRVWMDNSCETCGHKLSPEEMGRHVVN